MFTRRNLAATFVATALSATAHGVAWRHDVPAARALDQGARFPAVGRVLRPDGSATLVAPAVSRFKRLAFSRAVRAQSGSLQRRLADLQPPKRCLTPSTDGRDTHPPSDRRITLNTITLALAATAAASNAGTGDVSVVKARVAVRGAEVAVSLTLPLRLRQPTRAPNRLAPCKSRSPAAMRLTGSSPFVALPAL